MITTSRLIWNLLLIALIISGCKPPEPTYDGRLLSHWIDELYQYNEEHQLKAIRIIANMKTGALSAEPDLKQLAIGDLAGVPSTLEVKKAAVRALRMIGSEFILGVPISITTDSGSVDIDSLISGLYTDDPAKRLEIIHGLGAIGPNATDASDQLHEIAEGTFYELPTSNHLRKAAVLALKKIEPPVQEAKLGSRTGSTDDMIDLLIVEAPIDSLLKAWAPRYAVPKLKTGNVRTRIEVLIDSARMLSWLGDLSGATTVLHDLLQIDTLSNKSRKKVVKTMENLVYGKEGFSVETK